MIFRKQIVLRFQAIHMEDDDDVLLHSILEFCKTNVINRWFMISFF